MDARTLEQAFNAIFHKKENFSDFYSLDLSQQTEEFLFKDRKIYRTSKKTRSYLRFIDKVVLRHLSKNVDVVHSYIKEKSVLTAVRAHAGNHAFFLTDIESFFPNIGEDDVKRILERDQHVIPISDLNKYISFIAKLTTWSGALPIGFPTSPQLSNGFLFEFDNALHTICKSRSLIYTRYSDDIIISGDDRASLIDLKEIVQETLHQHASNRLFLNPDKTRITHAGNKVKILGLVITQKGQVTVDSKYKRTLETILHFFINDSERYDDFLRKNFDGGERSLFGLLHYVKATDPDYLNKLQRKYGILALRTLMEDKWRGK